MVGLELVGIELVGGRNRVGRIAFWLTRLALWMKTGISSVWLPEL